MHKPRFDIDEDVSSLLAALPEDQWPKDSEALAREFVKQKRLTKFQAEQISAETVEQVPHLAIDSTAHISAPLASRTLAFSAAPSVASWSRNERR